MIICGVEASIPSFVMETLSLGPKSAVLDKFDHKEVLAEIDKLLYHCKENNVSDETITDINVKTLTYIKKCKKLKSSRNIQLTKTFLKENNLLAVPFDKGVGICIMKKDSYDEKMNKIIKLPQFEKYVKPRKNTKNPVVKEEERIVKELKELLAERKISEGLYNELKPIGSQPPRLYGLAKVHKDDIPVRPVLSMPGSAYHKIGEYVSDCLSVVPQCNINASTKEICDKIKDTKLEGDEEMVSFDVVSLYTNVPVKEAIEVCAEFLFSQPGGDWPKVDKETFIKLAMLASCNVLMSTHDGYYIQKDGLAMGCPPAPFLANGWMSQYDKDIRGNSKIFFRYMDDVIQDLKASECQEKLKEINSLHPNLKFTMERESNHELPVLDMKIMHDHETGNLASTWYRKATDTGLIMNYHSLAPKRYKRSVVSGFVHRIFRACSNWTLFHDSLETAKKILESNQYPPAFYEPIIKQSLNSLVGAEEKDKEDKGKNSVQSVMIMIQYRKKAQKTLLGLYT